MFTSFSKCWFLSCHPTGLKELLLLHSRERRENTLCHRHCWETLNAFQNLQARCSHTTSFHCHVKGIRVAVYGLGYSQSFQVLVFWEHERSRREKFAFSQKIAILADLTLGQPNKYCVYAWLSSATYFLQ